MRHCFVSICVVAVSTAAAPLAVGQVSNPCIPNPVFPPDCVTQLGAIGEPVAVPTDEGFLNIASPVVQPIHRLSSANSSNGLLYVLNPTADKVRVLAPGSVTPVVKDIRTCYRPSSLSQNADGSLLLVACHASHALQLIDTATNEVTAMIQDRDADGRPLLQEPMDMAVDGNTVYVASSQNSKVAVVDLATKSVQSYWPVPGSDPRSLALTPDGAFLVVANLLAGNRTEAEPGFNASLLNPATAAGAVCEPLLSDPAGLAVFDENSPTFMDTSHPDFLNIADCYMLNQIIAPTLSVIINTKRSDHDLVVLRTSDGQVAFTTDSFASDIGTLNYDVAINAAGDKVYLATTHARNDLDENFGNRPILNQLVVLDLNATTGALTLPGGGIKDLDDPFLDTQGNGFSLAATPTAVHLAGSDVLVTATGSQQLLIFDSAGTMTDTVQVGLGPRGVVAHGGTAWVYNASGMTVSEVSLSGPVPQEVNSFSIGASALPQSDRIGGHLFNSAKFASNGTFSCASCHPEGHTDGLVWKLNAADHLRSTQTIQEIIETGPYHWDGSKCNLVQILQDGINNLFSNLTGPTDCEMETMIDWMNNLVRPHSPHRPLDDSMTDDAKLGLLIMHRGSFRDAQDTQLTCNGRFPDPNAEPKLLAKTGDPQGLLFTFNGGGGPFPVSVDSETCGSANCHVSPHWESGGFVNGNPQNPLIDGFQAVSNLGSWDRLGIMHDARPYREPYLVTLDAYRTVTGAPTVRPTDNMSGQTSTHGFNSQFFRHAEYTYDGNPLTHAFHLTDTVTQFSMEEEEIQTGSVGTSVVLDLANQNGSFENFVLNSLADAAGQGKVVFSGHGTLGGSSTTLTWDPLSSTFNVAGGGSLSMTAMKSALVTGDAMLFMGRLLPGQDTAPRPKLKAITRTTSPVLCIEAPTSYLATLQTGETDVSLLLHTIDGVDGSAVLVNGQASGATLTGGGPDYLWTLPAAGLTPTIHAIQILSPTGLQSNSVPLPVVPPVIPATEPEIDIFFEPPTFAPIWASQFGVTGPGTRSDVFRGSATSLRSAGLQDGSCLADDVFVQRSALWFVVDNEIPLLGNGFYYAARAENQINVTTWGSPARDAGIGASAAPCGVRFP